GCVCLPSQVPLAPGPSLPPPLPLPSPCVVAASLVSPDCVDDPHAATSTRRNPALIAHQLARASAREQHQFAHHASNARVVQRAALADHREQALGIVALDPVDAEA